MLRALKTILRHADDHARCRPRRCVPSLPDSASCLEDRVLLSAAGGMAHAAEVAQNPANTKAGREITNIFESILQTNPTGAQLTRFVHELRSGMSVRALRNELTAEARAQQGAQAPASVNAVTIHGGQSAAATASGRWAVAGTMTRVSAPTNTIVSPIKVSQGPRWPHISLAFGPASTQTMSTSTSSGTAGASMSATMSSTSTMTGMSSTSTMTGMSSTSTMTGMSTTTGMMTWASM
jgi:hypothetical protein